jgi:hypothetical protein
MVKRLCLCLALLVLMARPAPGQALPHGVIVDDVQCQKNAAQHYALYLPSNFTTTRRWPVILGFDAGGRGSRAVELYQAAAEKYGYIVVGSNNSRNGPWEPILEAAAAMQQDVEARFPIDGKRRYAAGMSGGARVSMALALKSTEIAGVLASSAGFPDDNFMESVPFPVFGTMGTGDFNFEEMHRLDRDLKSPHRVETFEGGHQWPPVALATDGVEWMEVQAMRRGVRPRDARLVDELFAKRMARADAQTSGLAMMRELKAIAADFKGLKDVAAVNRRASLLEAQQAVQIELKVDSLEDQREEQVLNDVFDLLNEPIPTTASFEKLKDKITMLVEQSNAAADSSDRRIARRVLANLGVQSRGMDDPRLQRVLEQGRPSASPQ